MHFNLYFVVRFLWVEARIVAAKTSRSEANSRIE